jgi:hypothetical protein
MMPHVRSASPMPADVLVRNAFEAMELGEDEPTRPVLLKMAKTYRRPLLVFYLAEPPRTGDRGQDFRTLPGHEKFNPELDALVRDIKARQGLIRSMLEDDKAEALEFRQLGNDGTPRAQACGADG